MSKPKSEDQSSLSLLSQQIDARSRQLAKKIKDGKVASVAFAGLDATNLGLSSKLIFEAKNSTTGATSADITKEWREFIFSPLGSVLTAAEFVLLLTLSMVGSYYEDDDENFYKRHLAILWPYVRDALKAVKWAYRLARNWVQVAIRFMDVDLRYLIMPIGLALGAVALLNRIWQRWMKTERKSMMKANTLLYEEVMAKGCVFHVLSSVPKSSDKTSSKLYANSYGYVKGIAKACGLLQMPPPVNTTSA